MQPGRALCIIGNTMKNFDELLTGMSKPEINDLKHVEMLAHAMSKSKAKSAITWWWLSIPLYILCAFVMKAMYNRNAPALLNLREFSRIHWLASFIFFIIVPVIVIIVNALSIKEVYFFSGSPRSLNFLKTVALNLMLILLSLIILVSFLFK